jgi:NADPH:quinone reductase-like Zn-dependent oxidoreductase/SAM-dependent methyltransferase
MSGDVRLYDEDGKLLGEIRGLSGRKTSRLALERLLQSDKQDWFYDVRWVPKNRDAARIAAAGLQDPNDVAAYLVKSLDLLVSPGQLEVYRGFTPAIENLAIAYVLKALREMGVIFSPGQRFSTGELQTQCRVIDQHTQVFARMIQMLAEEGILRGNHDEWEPSAHANAVKDDHPLDELAKAYPACEAELALFGRCAGSLAEVLTGQTDALQLLFPGGSLELAETLYQDSPAARAWNRLTQEAVARAIDQLPAECKLRVLEIGAGTGGTTAYLLERLPADRTEYMFTDTGPLFLANAKTKFAQYSFVRYATLDIERDPQTQGFGSQQFDVIVAANVLHATANLKETVTHVRSLLSPGGLLVLMELTERRRWVDLVFGLTEGWWRFQDKDARPDHPLMTERQWLQILDRSGFEQTVAVPGHGRTGDWSGQTVILARNPAESQSATANAENGDWLILSDRVGIGQRLAARLRERGLHVQLVFPDDSVAAPISPVRGVVHLWNVERASGEPSLEDVRHAQDRGTRSVLNLVQSMAQWEGAKVPRLWLVTENAQRVTGEERGLNVAQSPTWGLAKVVALEYPGLQCVRIDLPDRLDTERSAELLAEEIFGADEENEVAFRGSSRYVARLERWASVPHKADDPVRLEIPVRGVLDNLTLAPATRRPPEPGEVEIRVRAAGLNFRDVLNALGMYPGNAGPLGTECAGEIISLGPGVKRFNVGDRVVAIVPGAFTTFVNARAELAVPISAKLTFEEAAGIPLAFVTAAYALHNIAGMKAGDRVLIHAASGGVGLAAVQLAEQAGAEVFATAGSEEKRAYLRSIGIRHVMNSRTTEFADEILKRTDGIGVDIVLNSLTGESIARGLSSLRAGGTFLEIGRTEIWEKERVAAINPAIRYEVIGLDQLALDNAAMVGDLMAGIVSQVQEGRLRVLPLQTYRIEKAEQAFRFMAQAKHVGKIVLALGHADESRQIRPDATYLITGGMAGLGLLAADSFVRRGARSLVLMARSEASEECRVRIREWEQTGARVLTARGDVADPDAVRRVLNAIRQSMPPLRGVLHAAGVLDDGVLARQTWERFATVMAPKVDGAWNLHTLTRGEPLDFFVMFSSAASIFGSAGQGNHAAANAFMDALAHHRRLLGLAAQSINWGAWEQVGAAARKNVAAHAASRGMGSIEPRTGIETLHELIAEDRAQIAAIPIDWAGFLDQFAGGRIPPLLTDVAVASPTVGETTAPTVTEADLASDLEHALPRERSEILRSHLRRRALKVLGLPAAKSLDVRQPLNELGLDSLMAVELRNALGVMVGRTLPATLLFDHPTIEALEAYLSHEVLHLEVSLPETGDAPLKDDRSATIEQLEQLSDSEVETLLRNKLQAIEKGNSR